MNHHKQGGAALIVGLILLVVITVLSVSSMKMSRLSIVMSANQQFYIQAMNAAEAAIEAQIDAGSFLLTYDVPSNEIIADTPAGMRGSSEIEYINQGMAPDGGYSEDIVTYRFRIDAVGQAPPGDDARSTVALNQGIYILAPGN